MTPEEYAQECLQRIAWHYPALPSPNVLARMLKIVVTRAPRQCVPEGYDGLSMVEDDAWIILLNPVQSWVRRQWTLAHEIGHILQHGDVFRGLWHRDPPEQNRPLEQEADGFARAFLMPAELMWGLYQRYGHELGPLVSHLRLSQPAVKRRLRELGLRSS